MLNEIITICIKGTTFEHCQYNKEWKSWVKNRVDIIKRFGIIFHLLTTLQIFATKECLQNSIVNNKLWWFEPELLLRNKESWPEDKFVCF